MILALFRNPLVTLSLKLLYDHPEEWSTHPRYEGTEFKHASGLTVLITAFAVTVAGDALGTFSAWRVNRAVRYALAAQYEAAALSVRSDQADRMLLDATRSF